MKLRGIVNEVLGDHNVDKQMTDSRGDVCIKPDTKDVSVANVCQVAYLMADISDVSASVIKDLYQSLESLSCKSIGSTTARYAILIHHSSHSH